MLSHNLLAFKPRRSLKADWRGNAWSLSPRLYHVVAAEVSPVVANQAALASLGAE